jgi:excisionase family DNA binding protein
MDNSTDHPRLYRVDGALIELGIGRATLYRLIKSGEIRTVKIGKSRRIPAEALDEFVANLNSEVA